MAQRTWSVVLMVVVGAMLWWPATAMAQRGDVSDNVRFEEELNPNEFMITARMRAVTVPNFILGIFWDEHSSHWSEGQRNLSYGGEFVWRRGADFELGVAVDYADLSMPQAFWLDSGESAQSADWTEVDMQILSVVFSAYWFWDVQPWFTPFLGGGIGPGFILGEIVRYQPDRNSACYGNLGGAQFAPPECFRPDGQPDEDAINFDSPDVEDRVPPVVPMVNLTAGTRFNLGDHFVFKLEAGLYTYLYAGAAIGAQF